MNDSTNSAASDLPLAPKVEPFNIHDQNIPAGSAAMLKIPVSQQVTGLDSSLALKVLHGAKRGPCVFVSAGIHGDEIVGAAIVQRLLDHLCQTRFSRKSRDIF